MSTAPGGVQLRDRLPASLILHDVIAETIAQFPVTFGDFSFPRDAGVFRREYVELLPRFEAIRLSSPERTSIAAVLAGAMQERLVFEGRHGNQPLSLYLEPGTPLDVSKAEGSGRPGWMAGVEYRGSHWHDVAELGQLLARRNVTNTAAADSLAWLAAEALEEGRLVLTGRRIAIFGANAEMAATRLFLAAGADVLWLDQAPPPQDLLAADDMTGTLTWPTENADILTQPREILATLLKFAGDEALDLCLYAYAPGQAREVRLTGAMNALVNALPADRIASVTLLVSPTTPASLTSSDVLAMQDRQEGGPGWEQTLGNLGILGKPGCAQHEDSATTRTVVSIQGLSYQAAQYLGKLMMAECWADRGQLNQDSPTPLRVSANTAAITQTRSLDHPVFDAAFGGATAFQVETFTPAQSQAINGMLAIHDWLNPATPVPGTVRVHGGIHTLPYPLEKALRIAAAIGFTRSPGLLAGLVRR